MAIRPGRKRRPRAAGPKVRNQVLYGLLMERIGPVHVSNVGEEAVLGAPKLDIRTGIVSSNAVMNGEYFTCKCPYCNDTEKKLYVNYRWGGPDPISGRPMWHLAICFKNDCLKRHFYDFKERVLGFLNESTRDLLRQSQLSVTAASDDAVATILSPVALPGTVTPVDELPRKHKAALYLQDRRFDLQELSSVWQVGFCERADPAYLQADRRIIAPVVVDGDIVGWQGRWPDDINWKRAGISKYYTMPGFPRRLVLYNQDRALQHKFLVIVEGVTDVWRIGDPAVAMLGKTLSYQHREMLAALARRKGSLVLAWDPEAFTSEQPDPEAAKAKHAELMLDLQQMFRGRVVELQLPPKRDPAKFPSRRAIREFILDQARDAGLKLKFPEM